MKLKEGTHCTRIGHDQVCCETTEREVKHNEDFRLFEVKCHGQTHYSVTDAEGQRLDSFKDRKSAENDINDRTAVLLEDRKYYNDHIKNKNHE